MTKQTYRTRSNIILELEVRHEPRNEKPFYGSYSIKTNRINSDSPAFPSVINQGDAYTSKEEAIAQMLQISRRHLPPEFEEERWLKEEIIN